LRVPTRNSSVVSGGGTGRLQAASATVSASAANLPIDPIFVRVGMDAV